MRTALQNALEQTIVGVVLLTILVAEGVDIIRQFGTLALVRPHDYRGSHAGYGRGSRRNRNHRHNGSMSAGLSVAQTLEMARMVRLPRGKALLPVYPGSSYDLLQKMGIPA